MKKLENEWAAKRRTANDVSADVRGLRRSTLIKILFVITGRMDESQS